jgi:hypothetical protein
MRAHRVVILHVIFEDAAQVLLACHHDVVQAFPADRADQALRISILPRRPRRGWVVANAQPRYNRLETLVVDAASIEPVSASKFPANREKNREFFNFGPDRGSEVVIRPMIQRT